MTLNKFLVILLLGFMASCVKEVKRTLTIGNSTSRVLTEVKVFISDTSLVLYPNDFSSHIYSYASDDRSLLVSNFLNTDKAIKEFTFSVRSFPKYEPNRFVIYARWLTNSLTNIYSNTQIKVTYLNTNAPVSNITISAVTNVIESGVHAITNILQTNSEDFGTIEIRVNWNNGSLIFEQL